MPHRTRADSSTLVPPSPSGLSPEPARPLSGSSVDVAHVPLLVTSFTRAVSEFVANARDCGPFAVRFVNAYSIAVADSDPRYRALLNEPGVALPDGTPVGLLVRFKSRSGEAGGNRVRGPSFFSAVLDRGRSVGLSHFFLGGTAQSLQQLVATVEDRYPGLQVADTWAPKFGPADDAMIAEASRRISRSRPDVVWVSLGTPKQDYAAARLASATQRPVVAVGAAFDFESGSVRTAPRWMRGLGLEWIFRLSTEPRRLWRRYVFGNLRFLLAVLRPKSHGI